MRVSVRRIRPVQGGLYPRLASRTDPKAGQVPRDRSRGYRDTIGKLPETRMLNFIFTHETE